MSTTENVIGDLDELIESLRGSADAEYSTDSASPSPNADMKTLVTLKTLRARIAALVEAARPFDLGEDADGLSDDFPYQILVTAGDVLKLSEALRELVR